ncbi:MAG: hypothetical protein HYY22_07810 [Thaumarchaeota archaeon]|nr:hypothetical protein [Nitrososphaerota archaeon]
MTYNAPTSDPRKGRESMALPLPLPHRQKVLSGFAQGKTNEEKSEIPQSLTATVTVGGKKSSGVKRRPPHFRGVLGKSKRWGSPYVRPHKAPKLQIRYYRLMAENPVLSSKGAAEQLKLSENTIRWLRKQIRDRYHTDPISKYCPHCFAPTLQDVDQQYQACSKCGAEVPRYLDGARELFWGDDHSLVNNLLPGNGLGEEPNMYELRRADLIVSRPYMLSSVISRKKTRKGRFVDECMSQFLNLLKAFSYDEGATDEMARRLSKIAKRYARKTFGSEAVADVLTLFVHETSKTSKDYRLTEMEQFIEMVKIQRKSRCSTSSVTLLTDDFETETS